MHVLGILVFLLALTVAVEAIRSIIVANSDKILAALAEEPATIAHGTLLDREPARIVPLARKPVVSLPVSPLPLAA